MAFADTAVAAKTAVAAQEAVVPEAGVAAEAAIVGEGGLARDRRGRDLRSQIAVVALLVAIVTVSVFALNVRNPFSLEGEVAGVSGTPVAVAGAGSSPGQSPLQSPPAGANEAPISSSASASLAATTVVANPSGTPAAAGGVASSAPLPTPSPTPRRTATPAPRPTPQPTPRRTAAPTPCALVAPQLVGEHKANAATIWSGAGFTGNVTTLPGHGNYVIASQNRVAGQKYPCDASVTVGP